MIILQGVEIIALFVVMCFGVAQHQNGVADAMIEAGCLIGATPREAAVDVGSDVPAWA